MTQKLTPEQEVIVAENRERWIKIGLNCDPCDVEKSIECINKAYDAAKEKHPQNFYLYDSPASAAIGAAITDKAIYNDNKPGPAKKKYQAQTVAVYPRALESCLEQLKKVHNFTPTKTQLKDFALENLELDFYLNHQIYGSHDAPWLSFYDTWRKLGLEKEVEPLLGLIELASYCGWWAAYDRCAFLQHRHLEIHMNPAKQLHKDLGPAVRYADGFRMWYLNGVVVPQDIAETPGEKLDPNLILNTENVEIRREILRKIGPEIFIAKMGAKKIEDEKNAEGQIVYELLSLKIGTRNEARALKMLNPSVPELWHVEFVPDSTKTIDEALMFRAHLTPDMIDNVNGADWFEQGDICLFPKGAKKFKLRPKKLT